MEIEMRAEWLTRLPPHPDTVLLELISRLSGIEPDERGDVVGQCEDVVELHLVSYLSEALEELDDRTPTAAEASFALLLRMAADVVVRCADAETWAPEARSVSGSPEELQAFLRLALDDLMHGYDADGAGDGFYFVAAAEALSEWATALEGRGSQPSDDLLCRYLCGVADEVALRRFAALG